MKKILIILSLVFIISLGCKKLPGGGNPCACSPVSSPPISLVIKNSADADLLNPATIGYFEKTKIKLFAKGANGVDTQINFDIRPPFTYSDKLKVTSYQLSSSDLIRLSKSIDNTFYLKLGENKVLELNLKITNNNVEKLLVDKIEAPKEIPNVTEQYLNNFFTVKI